jgi:t-SNARE complex subunit (syntaxin)
MEVELTTSFLDGQTFESIAALVEEINETWERTFESFKNLTDHVDEAEAWDKHSLSRHDIIMRKLQRVTSERAQLLQSLEQKASTQQQKIMARAAQSSIQDSLVSYEDFKKSMENMLEEAVERRRSTIDTTYPSSPQMTSRLMLSKGDSGLGPEFNIVVYNQEQIIDARQKQILEIERQAGDLRNLAGEVVGQVYATGEKVDGINEK